MTGRDSATAALGRALKDVLAIVGFLRGKADWRTCGVRSGLPRRGVAQVC
jgi:hypothetical protein